MRRAARQRKQNKPHCKILFHIRAIFELPTLHAHESELAIILIIIPATRPKLAFKKRLFCLSLYITAIFAPRARHFPDFQFQKHKNHDSVRDKLNN